ncbi:tripartite tricarboxylate transporter substrate binding protein [Sulfitobacter sp. M220]|jgi:tripartite-type tricarboxylate transporter receptor subunit TctC|uniref:Tripartite tricarboxylate transporter substrate binding protein n=2 Tax=root TaxID=1 RepID=A0A7V1BEA3_9RHOB|nr:MULTISPECIES: tripartite tricarboxylate transporter substrate binding protein [Sulfitobacter]MCF7728566.1 tripartite tricarboxylate transporter substrate binding protein [Sulfitobacter sp. M22]MCF7779484.1 tripartite tricarboxylate transporter substrate binding protein [Sulfitobacter sp. M220]HDY96437.1 tripartite tricarboxylate transporter substrate binding protein [Sulfitobacter litoralis]HDZ51593.1 tripartite tricarboxylate transporter substrate binding protein [Sulfitobacter litoralis]|tara:strand:+ start:544 stop:1491 length:948 start_codon:yes stop_codon:yes gene_type:complete
MTFRSGLAALFTAASLLAVPATAETYPERAVEFIVPWSPGGGSDTLMRLVANNVQPFLGAEMPVINMPGVGGTVGLREASRRAADGYTISQVHEGLLVATETGITDLAWDDFDPIALMTASPQYLVAGKSDHYSNFEEFVTYAKAHPGEISMGVTLAGVPHLHAAMIEQAFGLEFKYVGYEGTGERVRALVGGNLDVAIGDISSSKQFVDNGDLTFLAVGATERVAAAADVPTFKELGQDLELNVTRGIVMPKGAPQEVRDTLEAALKEMAQDPTYIEQTNNAGADVGFRGQEDYRAYLTKLDETVKSLSSVLAP